MIEVIMIQDETWKHKSIFILIEEISWEIGRSSLPDSIKKDSAYVYLIFRC